MKELAARQKVSVAALIRRAVREWLETSAGVSDIERRRRALAVIGQFRSGLSDVSERHDDYLAEAYGE
ncbi:MAG: ribbon-helix-helix protein, CopG family [Anaerolineae bacterium]|uniref:ribbon-helix-helix protein, CopG family n=1 Tax=Thermoflexus sp. TaxID=1969742 RepID=UPI0025D7F37E|nr:ribbon-helix-helix protein, CopG family [Thermoflexus sp.]MCS7350016.1 ribbon-helix-helix protein, CopG family [Thermoflexus sp.]MDW8179464.1 ribbon-helix-helix protein, CopG family [Anaerolineae bacterium]